MGMLEIEEVAAHFRRPPVEKTLDELIERAAACVDYGGSVTETPEWLAVTEGKPPCPPFQMSVGSSVA